MIHLSRWFVAWFGYRENRALSGLFSSSRLENCRVRDTFKDTDDTTNIHDCAVCAIYSVCVHVYARACLCMRNTCKCVYLCVCVCVCLRERECARRTLCERSQNLRSCLMNRSKFETDTAGRALDWRKTMFISRKCYALHVTDTYTQSRARKIPERNTFDRKAVCSRSIVVEEVCTVFPARHTSDRIYVCVYIYILYIYTRIQRNASVLLPLLPPHPFVSSSYSSFTVSTTSWDFSMEGAEGVNVVGGGGSSRS